MSLTFKFDKSKEEAARPEGASTSMKEESTIESYDSDGHVRNICFVENTGAHTFLNYAYLVSAHFNPDASSLNLSFTTHIVSLKGYRLETLFQDIFSQRTKIVRCVEKRYADTLNPNDPVIAEMTIAIVQSS